MSEMSQNTGEQQSGSGYLAVCGISFRTATLSEREAFHIGRSDLVPAVKLFKTLAGVREVTILATCNRLEIYMFLDEGADSFVTTCEFFRRLKGVEAADKRKLFYIRHGSTVARHLFRVIAGIESLVLGEYQIQSQVKEAYSAACSAKGAHKALHKLFHSAFRVGKAVRSRTSLGAGQYSVSGVALRILKDRIEKNEKVLIVGVNESTRIVAAGLSSAGFENLLFANRTASKAEKMAVRFGGEGIGLDDVPGLVARSRGILCCTGAPGAVISARTLERASARGHHPSIIVDMAVPRDVERPTRPGNPAEDATEFVDLEDLKVHLETEEKERQADLPLAERLIEDVVATFQVWMESAFDQGVANLAKEFDRIRRKCLDEARGHFSPDNTAELERFSRLLMQNLLKVPTRTIMENGKKADESGSCRLKRLARKVDTDLGQDGNCFRPEGGDLDANDHATDSGLLSEVRDA